MEKPTVRELQEALMELGVPHVVEHTKRHPADFFTYGRVRFCMDRDGKSTYMKLTKRIEFFTLIAEQVQKLDREAVKVKYTPRRVQEAVKAAEEAKKEKAAPTAPTTKPRRKKKGRRRG